MKRCLAVLAVMVCLLAPASDANAFFGKHKKRCCCAPVCCNTCNSGCYR